MKDLKEKKNSGKKSEKKVNTKKVNGKKGVTSTKNAKISKVEVVEKETKAAPVAKEKPVKKSKSQKVLDIISNMGIIIGLLVIFLGAVAFNENTVVQTIGMALVALSGILKAIVSKLGVIGKCMVSIDIVAVTTLLISGMFVKDAGVLTIIGAVVLGILTLSVVPGILLSKGNAIDKAINSTIVVIAGLLLLTNLFDIDSLVTINVIGLIIIALAFMVKIFLSQNKTLALKLFNIITVGLLAAIYCTYNLFEEAELALTIELILLIVGIVGSAVSSKKAVLLKSILGIALVGIIGTWVLANGTFSGTTFSASSMARVGLTDVSTLMYYGIYFVLDKVVYLIALAAFYGVLSKTEGYAKLVNNIAKKMESSRLLFVILVVLGLAALGAILSQTMVALAFVPFAVSILSRMKVDKLTTMVATFGSVILGTMAAPWGTEAIEAFNYYTSQNLETGFVLRLILEGIAIVLFILFVGLRLTAKKNKELEAAEDPYELEEVDNEVNETPVKVSLIVMAVIAILAYVNWESYLGVKYFKNLFDTVMKSNIGSSITSILGNSTFSETFGSGFGAFGTWSLLIFAAVIMIFAVVIAVLNKIEISDFLEACEKGIKAMIKPIVMFMIAFVVFGIPYTCQFSVTMANSLYSMVEGFNPIVTILSSFVTAIFHMDFGFSGYAVGAYALAAFKANADVVHTIYVATHGLVQILLPTSGLLVLGLTYTKTEYKSWLKYIWKFALSFVAVLVIVALIATYAA